MYSKAEIACHTVRLGLRMCTSHWDKKERYYNLKELVSTSQPAQPIYKFMQNPNVRRSPCPRVLLILLSDWAVAKEVFDCFQIFLIATYPAIVRLGSSVPDPCQLSKLAVPCVMKGIANFNSVLAMSIAGHKLLDTQNLHPSPQHLRSFSLTHPVIRP